MLSKVKPCIVRQGLSWKHWFLFQSQSPTTILTIWLRLLARWCNTGSPTMRIFWLKKLSLSVRLHNQWSIQNLKIWLHRLICCKPRTDHFFKKWLACGLQENDSTQGKWSHNDASHKALHIKAAQGKSIKAAVSTSHNKTKKGLPFHPKYAAFVLPFPTNLRITLDWQWDPKSLWSSLPSTILIPCPFVIGHTNTGSWIVEENSSTIQFPQCCHQHWSQLVTEVLFNQLSNVQSMSDMYTTSWKCITLFLDSRNDGLQYLKTIVSGVGSDLIGVRENDCGLSQLIRLHFSSSYAGLK